MSEKRPKSANNDKAERRCSASEEYGNSTTLEIPRHVSLGEMPTGQRAFFEIIGLGERPRVVELAEGEIFIGRSQDCDIQLSPNDVSRRHASLVFRNEEYHIKDLDSTNGTYVNGVRIVKCVLKNNDQIEIGGVKLLFNEEKTIKQS